MGGAFYNLLLHREGVPPRRLDEMRAAVVSGIDGMQEGSMAFSTARVEEPL